MHDLVIRGGSIADGTGKDRFAGDIAVADGKIVQVGGKAGPAKREIDADGALVTPGFVDIHSHYDGQATWDDTIDPSFSNGITTTMMGNCGVGFAPAKPTDRELMIAVMEGVEAIPGIVLAEGVPWKWQSFPEYMDFLAERSYGLDIGTLAPHAPMRVFAMGQRAVTHEQATAEELDTMVGLVRDAMNAGAFGISAGRIAEHIYGDDRANVPGTFAEEKEFFALADAMAEGGRGFFQVVPRGAAGASPMSPNLTREDRIAEHKLIVDMARRSGRPVHFLLPQIHSDPEDWAMMLEATRKANAEGLEIYAHVAARGAGMNSMLDGYHFFQARPSYREIAHLPLAKRAEAMRDPGLRARMLAEEDLAPNLIPFDEAQGARMMKASLPGGRLLFADHLDEEPTDDMIVHVIAKRLGTTPEAVTYDHLASDDGRNVIAHYFLNYGGGSLDGLFEMLRHPNSLSSLGDGGAHMKFISDAASMPLHLTFWARDRKRGPTHRLESMVNRITGHNAKAIGLNDRGVLAVGKRADINVMDFENMATTPFTIRHDLPAGGARMQQGTTGFLATMLNGVVTRQDDTDTGARPGRLMRANRLS